MVEFATSVFIMDSGPKQSIDKTVKIFGLNESARLALQYKVHGPKSSGANFLAQFSTKFGINTQLITSTVGPQELWAFNTNADDASVRRKLYQKIGAKNARVVLAKKYPSGSAVSDIEKRLSSKKQKGNFVVEEESSSVIDEIVLELVDLHNNLENEKLSKLTEKN
jgi:intracellular multiplication protein IcmB